MPSILAGDAEPAVRPPGYLAGPAAPRRASLAAACGAAALVAQLLLTPLTLAVLICMVLTGRLTRWRPLWLAGPAAAGAGLVLLVGTGPAAAGYTAPAARIWAVLAGAGPLPPRLAHLPEVLAGSLRLLPAQLPVALGAAAAEAWLLHWAGRDRRTSGGARGYRPGLLAAIRRAYLTAALRRGEVATADGGCLGLAGRTWSRLAVSWREAEHGVLCAGQDQAAVAATGLDLATAAILHRKAVVVVDLTRWSGRPGSVASAGGGSDAATGDGDGDGGSHHPPLGVADLVAPACARAGTVPRRLGGAGQLGTWAGYDPLAGLAPGQAADRLVAMIDWSAVDGASRPFCTDYLSTVLDVLAATGDRGRPLVPVLAQLAGLLGPFGLGKRLAGLSGPGTGVLAARAERLCTELSVHPAVLAPIEAQFAALDSSPLRDRLGRPGFRFPASGGLCDSDAGKDADISLYLTLADRGVVLFDLDRRLHGQAADMLARLVVADLTAILRGRRAAGTPCDCLIWVNGCEAIGPGPLADLIALGPQTGTAVVLGTADGRLTPALADQAGVLVIRGRPPPAARAAWTLAGPRNAPDDVTALDDGHVAGDVDQMAGEHSRADALWVRVRVPRERLVTGRAVR